jgi:HEPN domain-containing protein
VLLEKGIIAKKTHSIRELVNLLVCNEIIVNISDEAIDLIDSIYLPSKYPLGNAMPFFETNKDICIECLLILDKVKKSAEGLLD